ncbi:MAG TPA: nitrite reductase small subunit NirD [Casimicrobiaceae bacterium]|nr:nitrite reductase small subunit NirD [Casimicrobiaceae bacterium]
MSGWSRVCRIEEIPVLGARVLERAHASGDNVAVFRTANDRIFALRDRCPHKGGPLSQGIVYGESVACPLHGWNIDLDSGCAHAPDRGCAQRVAVHVDAGTVYLKTGDAASRVPAAQAVERADAGD